MSDPKPPLLAGVHMRHVAFANDPKRPVRFDVHEGKDLQDRAAQVKRGEHAPAIRVPVHANADVPRGRIWIYREDGSVDDVPLRPIGPPA